MQLRHAPIRELLYVEAAFEAQLAAFVCHGVCGELLLRQWSRVNAFAQHKRRTDAADDSRLPRQSGTLPQAVYGFDSRAMCAEHVGYLELLQLVAGPIQLLVAGRKQVQAADNRIDRFFG